jgi:hypothetical protein
MEDKMEASTAAIDRLLRRSLAAPVPNLPPDFDQRVLRELRQASQPLDRYRQLLLIGYGLVSIMVSAVVMRGQGLAWESITEMTLGPLALVAVATWAWSATHRTMRQPAT